MYVFSISACYLPANRLSSLAMMNIHKDICIDEMEVFHATYSEHVDASIEWQFWVHEYINELLKP